MRFNLGAIIGSAKPAATIQSRIDSAVAIAGTVQEPKPFVQAPPAGSRNEWAADAIANPGESDTVQRVQMPARDGGQRWIECNAQDYADRVRYLEEHDEMTTSDAQGCADAEVWAAQRSLDNAQESRDRIAQARAKQEAARAALETLHSDAPIAEKAEAINDMLAAAGVSDRIEVPASERAEALAEFIESGPSVPINEAPAWKGTHLDPMAVDAQRAAAELAVTPGLVTQARNKETGATLGEDMAAIIEGAAVKRAAKAKRAKKAAKRPVGRPKKPGALNGAQRQAKSQEELRAVGGKRTTLNLSPGAVLAIAEIKASQGLETDREAVEVALLTFQLQEVK